MALSIFSAARTKRQIVKLREEDTIKSRKPE